MKVSLGQAMWRKSSHSGQSGQCVEVAGTLKGTVAVRDSKDPDGPTLVVGPDSWRALARRIKGGGLT
jgi:hypothetical protein